MDVMVSVDCATYNQGKYISWLTKGFQAQKTVFIFEILTGEDCCFDSTQDIVCGYTEKPSDLIKSIINEYNAGGLNSITNLNEKSVGKNIALC